MGVIYRDFPRIVNLRTVLWLILQDIDELHSSEGAPVDPPGSVTLRRLVIPSSFLERRRS